MTEKVLKVKNLIWKTRVETLNVAAIIGVTALTIFYLFMANNVAMENYRKTILQKNIDNLRTEIHNLNLELTSKRSIGFLKKAAAGLNLVINESIQYIKITGPVAKNQ